MSKQKNQNKLSKNLEQIFLQYLTLWSQVSAKRSFKTNVTWAEHGFYSLKIAFNTQAKQRFARLDTTQNSTAARPKIGRKLSWKKDETN